MLSHGNWHFVITAYAFSIVGEGSSSAVISVLGHFVEKGEMELGYLCILLDL